VLDGARSPRAGNAGGQKLVLEFAACPAPFLRLSLYPS
jgi:hypothetical protein